MPSEGGSNRRGVPSSSVPDNPEITNINSLLNDVYLRYIALNDEDFEKYYKVIDSFFQQLHGKMKEVDPYYSKYSSQAHFAGSHPDRLRINKPDEFDIDIVIKLPINEKENPLDPQKSDFTFEATTPGFTQLKMGVQFQNLPDRDDWDINKTAYKWLDTKNYLLGSEFKEWFNGVVDKAFMKYFVEKPNSPPKVYVDGVPYIVEKAVRDGCPAVTMFLENKDKNIKIDVDLVPSIRVPIERWPINKRYRELPPEFRGADKKFWMLVPKPNKLAMKVQKKKKPKKKTKKPKPAKEDNNNPSTGVYMEAKRLMPYFMYSNEQKTRETAPIETKKLEKTEKTAKVETAAVTTKKAQPVKKNNENKRLLNVPILKHETTLMHDSKQTKPITRLATASSLGLVKTETAEKAENLKKPAKTNPYKNRSWGISMHEHEATIMHDSMHMKQVAQFMKKLRDSQDMNKITSYFIKTIFFWEVKERQYDEKFWYQPVAILFELMLKKFHGYLESCYIPCFWHKTNNLLENVDKKELKNYAAIVKDLLNVLNRPSEYKKVAKYLLTEDEFLEYNTKFLHI